MTQSSHSLLCELVVFTPAMPCDEMAAYDSVCDLVPEIYGLVEVILVCVLVDDSL